MRGADTFTEGLFTLKRLDDFVPAHHPLRAIRTMINKALADMGELFAQMYADDVKGGRSQRGTREAAAGHAVAGAVRHPL